MITVGQDNEGLMVSIRVKAKLQVEELPEKSVTVIVIILSDVSWDPIVGIWVTIGLESQLSEIVNNELKSVTTYSQLELKYWFVFKGKDKTGTMVSNRLRLKSQLFKLPDASVIVIVITVSEFTVEPTSGLWVMIGFKSQLSENEFTKAL